MIKPDRVVLEEIARRALSEDIGAGDLTTGAMELEGGASADFIFKEDGVLCGRDMVETVFRLLDPESELEWEAEDGDWVRTNSVAGEVTCGIEALLSGERVALNFLQRMSGIATMARRFADAVEDTGARVLDTRKTTPGLRALEKYAVRVGGACNHRLGLYDMVLIKDNHIKAVGGIARAVELARGNAPASARLEVEVADLDGCREALEAGADVIMFDNMSLVDIKRGADMCKGKAVTEASGNVDLNTAAQVAACGVDYISAGALTHSVKAIDISLKIS